jgi:hypothetical protein
MLNFELKSKLVDVAFKQKSWGKLMPMATVPLELQISDRSRVYWEWWRFAGDGGWWRSGRRVEWEVGRRDGLLVFIDTFLFIQTQTAKIRKRS